MCHGSVKLVTSFSLQRPGLSRRVLHVGFSMGRIPPRQVFLRALPFPVPIIITPVLPMISG
jgi:hypothetical protein